MTNPDILKLKAIQTLLEAIEIEDEDDAKQTMKLIRSLLGEAKSSN